MHRRKFIEMLGGCAAAFEAIRGFANQSIPLEQLQVSNLAQAADHSLDFTLNATPASALSLSGKWHIANDPENVGKIQEWHRRGPREGAFPCEVPNPLELTFPNYDGVVWYWRSFDAGQLIQYDDVRIHFQGADYYAEAWLNGEYLGGNESALLPFAFPVKKAIRPGMNQLVVRVIDACYAKEIDGFQFPHVPKGRQADDSLQSGWLHYNYGGLLLPVSVQAFRRPWIAEGFIQPDIRQNKIDVDLMVIGEREAAEWNVEICPVYPVIDKPVVQQTIGISPDSQGHARISIRIPTPRLWKVWDGFLYQIRLTLARSPNTGTAWQERFGMREVSILNGRIAVNGEQILQRSFLYNQIWPVTLGVPHQYLARRDVELTRRVNANMLRCFCKTPVPATVEAADEAGILLQPETLASWYLVQGEKERQRLKNLTQRGVLLYRNHPSILWWNILNENAPQEDPKKDHVFGLYPLREILPSVHALDPTRPALTNDPIWHEGGSQTPGMSCPPNVWEPGQSQPSLPMIQDHYYQFTALENHEDSWLKLRGRAWGEKPNPGTPFLAVTEWGQNSSPQWDQLIQSYKSSGVREDAEDYVVNRKLREMNRVWYLRSGIAKKGFPTFESVEHANQESVAQRYREHFALFWGNVHCVGHGMTSLEDSSYELSGVLDFWRNPKPVVFDSLAELNRPLQINLWVRPSSVYANDAITFDATLVNEGRRLQPGPYSLSLRIIDSIGRVGSSMSWRHQVVGDPIEFLMVQSIRVPTRPGLYRLTLQLAGGKDRLTAERPIRVFERTVRSLGHLPKLWVWEKGDEIQKWLQSRGIESRKGDVDRILANDLLVILDAVDSPGTIKKIHSAVRQGAHAIFLRPESVLAASTGQASPVQSYSGLLESLSGDWKPELREIGWWGSPGAWGYSRTALALRHPFLDGLPQAVALEAQPVYQRVAPKFTWLLTNQPELAEIDCAVVETALNVDMPYTADLLRVTCGKGTFVLNTLRLGEGLSSDPAADRILENILMRAARTNKSQNPKRRASEKPLG